MTRVSRRWPIRIRLRQAIAQLRHWSMVIVLGEIAAAVGQPLDAHPIIEGLSQLSFYDGHLSAP